MPFIYYGYTPRARGATKLAVETDSGTYEPMEPSKVKVFTMTIASFIFSSMVACLGHVIGILSYPAGTFFSISTPGLMVQPDDTNPLPFANPGLALVLKKGGRLSDADAAEIENRGFTMMSFASRTIFFKDGPTDLDYDLGYSARDAMLDYGGEPSNSCR